jgi:hypothetical protein
MQQKSDTRLARAKAKASRGLPAARHRSLLRARAALAVLLRGESAPAAGSPGLTGALQLSDIAAAELARLPDTPGLRENDLALLARDHAGAEAMFEARLRRLVQQFREGREPNPANASPAELLAAWAAMPAEPPAMRPPRTGKERVAGALV